jgi:hypothetical protein
MQVPLRSSDAPRITNTGNPQQLRTLRSSLENAVRSVIVAQNEFSLMNKIPPETLITISEFVAGPRTRKSMLDIVKMTHICQYWRSTLTSCPHLWSSIFVQNDHRDFVAACLERSREVPLTVCLNLKYGDYHDYPDCTCIRNEWSSGMQANENNPCRYHTTIDPLLEADPIKRIHKLDVHLSMLDNDAGEGPDEEFKDALDEIKFFAFPLPNLNNLSFSVDHEFDVDSHLKLPGDLFFWRFLPPTKLRHLTLYGCFGGPIRAVRNLTSFELAGSPEDFDPIELNQHTFLPFISGSPSLVSLTLSHCSFPDRAQLSRVTPVKLPKLKTLRLMDIYELPGLPGLVEVPAFKTISLLRISTQTPAFGYMGTNATNFQVHAESDDGFQLVYDTSDEGDLAPDWLGVTRGADPSPAFVRFEGRDLSRCLKIEASPLPLFVNAKVLEIGASFADLWYQDFWNDLEKIGPQLTTLRLEVIQGMEAALATSVKRFAKARLEKGTPLMKLERMTFEGVSEGDEENAKGLWEEFLVGFNIDQYLVPQ